ncbi:MAG: SDR family NAD(P)-dependent oxidoreductase [Neisseria sp.]|nr:SDR family NAD(P)-dependent oxidoreductase [Neisseria sp.]
MNSAAILGMGYLGRPLAERLYENGWQVSALKRDLTSDDICLPIELHTQNLNALSANELQTAWQAWREHKTWIALLPPSAVANYAEVIASWAQSAEQFGVQHLIFSSSISVYGSQTRVCDEHSELHADTASAQTIVAAENVLLNSKIANVDILRLGGLHCSERHPVRRLLQQERVPNGQQVVNVLHRERAVAALLRATQQPNGKRVRNIVQNAHPSRAEFYSQEAANLGLPSPCFVCDNSENTGKKVQTAYADFADLLNME